MTDENPETLKGRVISAAESLSFAKERAVEETLQALKTVYPNRWQEIWAALSLESTPEKIAAGVSAAAVHDPAAAIGGLVGTAIGAVLGSYAGRATRRRRKR